MRHSKWQLWPGVLDEALERRLEVLVSEAIVSRIWERDPLVWTDDPSTPEITDRLGWLTGPSWSLEHLAQLSKFAGELPDARVVLLGMGGSSLAPEVIWQVMGSHKDPHRFEMLDSTNPATIGEVDRARSDESLFVVSSKSGSTIETASLFEYFWKGTGGRGDRFVAVTDAGSALEEQGRERGLRRVFLNPTDIGGRFSALSYFGLVPAALSGVELSEPLNRASEMMERCRAEEENPGAVLGAVLGEAALSGRDKLTVILSERLRSLGLWLEQLIAESTGKNGLGLLPVLESTVGPPESYGDDRLFVFIRLEDDHPHDVVHVTDQGHPAAELVLSDPQDLLAELYRWEFATAVTGWCLGVNPFDQPNVAESKKNTSRILSEGLERLEPYATGEDLERLLQSVRPGDYLAILVYDHPSPATDRLLDQMAVRLRDRARTAVTWGYGPRYLHSTGQLHKGGPDKGHFIQLLPWFADDLEIPGQPYSFGTLIHAQAQGDLEALRKRGRPILRLEDPEALRDALG